MRTVRGHTQAQPAEWGVGSGVTCPVQEGLVVCAEKGSWDEDKRLPLLSSVQPKDTRAIMHLHAPCHKCGAPSARAHRPPTLRCAGPWPSLIQMRRAISHARPHLTPCYVSLRPSPVSLSAVALAPLDRPAFFLPCWLPEPPELLCTWCLARAFRLLSFTCNTSIRHPTWL